MRGGGGLAFGDETYTLESTVISASGYEQEIKYAPASISIIPKEEILNKPIRDLGDIVQEVPGLSTEVAKTGAQNISIRGMSSDYTLILIDGKRANLSKGFDGNGFDSTTGFMPPLSMIERVEVIRGPASTIYGSDAMGGVINIITKKSTDKISASVGFNTRLQEDTRQWGNSSGVDGNIFLPLGESFSLNLRGKYQYGSRNAFWKKDVPGYTGTTTNPYTSHSPTGYINSGFGGRLNWTMDEQNSFYFDGEFGFQRLGSLNTSGRQITAIRDYFKTNFILNHDGKYDFGHLNSFVQYATTQRLSHTDVEIGADSGKRNWEALRYNPILTYQSTLNTSFDFGDAGALILNLGPYFMTERMIFRDSAFDNRSWQVAIFGEGEYIIGDIASVTAGIRANQLKIFGTYLTPRGYINIFPTEWLSFKFGVAGGLKAPELSYYYDGLYFESTTVKSYGNKDLKPETNLNYEASTMITSPLVNLTLTGYYTNFKDAITSRSYQPNTAMPNGITCEGQGITCGIPENVDKAVLYGAEVLFGTGRDFKEMTGGFGIDTSFAYTKTKRKSGEFNGKPLNNIAKFNASAKLSFEKGSWGSYLRYIGKLRTPTFGVHSANVGPGKHYKDVHTVDLGLSYKTKENLSLSFVVNNLLNFNTIDYFTYQSGNSQSYSNSYQRMIPGRNYWLNLRADF
ncbi:TonB-dependent receptor domain-containing protein [Campylobacter troglodytis]|uniref:TonB-dependent receptor domain-containing protein n=1 Tax=Campylobacter troglodytis TaxID=654363 RepID=UPI0011594067|nr:TonB-dependent receptor [Campylobacter troglodytis]TQR59067.1 ferric enterobactin uptake receptor [Campylobacter troglodytis]